MLWGFSLQWISFKYSQYHAETNKIVNVKCNIFVKRLKYIIYQIAKVPSLLLLVFNIHNYNLFTNYGLYLFIVLKKNCIIVYTLFYVDSIR